MKKLPEETTKAHHVSLEKSGSINYNGFTRRPPCTQIVPVVCFVFMLIHINYYVPRSFPSAVFIPIIAVHSLLSLVVIFFWYSVCKIDPTDRISVLYRKSKEDGKKLNEKKGNFYCETCQTGVEANSFHCSKCNRCVQMFDHHCKWVNNCIGAKNYFEFVSLVVSFQIYLILFLALLIELLIQESEHHPLSFAFFFHICILVVNIVILAPMSVLAILHVYLMVMKKTTISLIKEKRKQDYIINQLEISTPVSKQVNDLIQAPNFHQLSAIENEVTKTMCSSNKCQSNSNNYQNSYKNESENMKGSDHNEKRGGNKCDENKENGPKSRNKQGADYPRKFIINSEIKWKQLPLKLY